MCGICGIAVPEKSDLLSDRLIASMCRTIVHRGPDDEGRFIGDLAALGARRLSIIDVEGGHQPIASEDGTVHVAHNGEIYNFPDLRKELLARGHVFRTRTDTETVLHAYEEWGDDFVQHLRGMFATAVWDSRRKRMVIIRDRIGIKPLYYTQRPDGTLIFGSEIKTILACPGIERNIDPEALDLFLTLEYIPAPLSIFKGIYKLPAGHMLVYELGNTTVEPYWDITSGSSQHKETTSVPEAMDNLYELLKESVRMRLISDVPLGAFLSGGVDSSAIVGLMRELGASPLKTFSIGFEDQTYNELDHARRISQRFETEHQEFTCRPQALELTEKLIRHLDEPFGDFSIFPTFLVSQMAREHVTVILSGDGGDEVFGGYEHYQAQKISRCVPFPSLFRPLSSVVNALPPTAKKKGAWNKLQRFTKGFLHPSPARHLRWMMFLSNSQKRSLYSPDFISELGGSFDLHSRPPLSRIFDDLSSWDTVNGELYLDLKSYLPDDILVKVDRMSMAASLETRVPLLDHKVAEYVFSLPGRLKLKGMTTKWLFKKTMERLLPRENIYRKKEGFSIPIKHWLKTDLKDLMEETLSEKKLKEDGFLNPLPIHRMKDDHLRGKKNYSHQLWALLVYMLWKDQYLG